MTDLAARAAAMAVKARAVPKPASTLDRSLAREWWTITRNGKPTDVFFDPPQAWDQVRAWYPDAEVAPKDGP